MKLVSYIANGTTRSGVIVEDAVVDLAKGFDAAKAAGTSMSGSSMPSTMLELLQNGDAGMEDANAVASWAASNDASACSVALQEADLVAPVPNPPSMRDGYAFRQHVESARRNRGLEMIPEFDQFPIFYMTNHNAVYGPGDIPVMPRHLEKLDFELEAAIVIGKECRNVSAANADDYIAGYTVMNDWSARAMQMEEMKLNLGPAKGKDFATSIGPWLVTRDELASRRIPSPEGERFDLEMTCVINGKNVSKGNVKDMTWTFAQIVERASYGVTLKPGDVIGSGTCGTGCFLELNGSKVYDPAWWLTIGDVVVCAIDQLGVLSNTVVAEKA